MACVSCLGEQFVYSASVSGFEWRASFGPENMMLREMGEKFWICVESFERGAFISRNGFKNWRQNERV